MVLPLPLSEKETEWSRRQKGAIDPFSGLHVFCKGEKGQPLQSPSPSALTSCTTHASSKSSWPKPS